MAINVIVIAIDDRPKGLIPHRPAASENAVHVHRVKRLPIKTNEERSECPFYACNPPRCLSIRRRNAVPDSPDVFPAFPTFPVEEGELQIGNLVFVPAIRDVNHVTGFEPPVAIDARNKLKLVISPREDIPRKCLVACTNLGL